MYKQVSIRTKARTKKFALSILSKQYMIPRNLPVGLTSYQEPRKISKLNLENAFSFVSLWVNLLTAPYKPELIGVVGLIYNKIQISFMRDAVRCISLIKRTRAWYVAYIRGGNPGSSEFKGNTEWNYEEKCPIFLQGVLGRLESCQGSKKFSDMADWHQVVFTLLSFDRIIVIPAVPNYSSITNPYSGPSSDSEAGKALVTKAEIREALESMGVTPSAFKERFEQMVSKFDYEVLTSSGPNGPATWTAHSDVRAWTFPVEIHKQLRVWLEESGMSFMIRDMEGVISLPNGDIAPDRKPRLGKLNVIEEWGGKARIVASLDYWTQMAMSPLHNTINHFMKGYEKDGTFFQEEATAFVKSWSSKSGFELNCHDLTAATDRLPISLQREILTILLGSPSLSKAWSRILSGRTFITPEGDMISYAVGQPMGARSSFPMLALTHHVIMHIAAKRAEYPTGWDYRIVGDDSAILSNAMSDKYVAIMNAYGVEINETKSVLFGEGLLPAGELCKHTFVEGIELSVIPIKTVCKAIMDGREVGMLQNELIKRFPSLTPGVFWTLVSSFLDKETIKTHLKNNFVPSSVSGLIKGMVPNGHKFAKPSSWFPGVELTEQDVIEVYTWTAAVEALKRLDSLLRTSLGIGALIEHAAERNDASISPWLRPEAIEEVKEVAQEMAGVKGIPNKEVPPLNRFHPIVRASQAEASRLSDLLFMLASADSNMVEAARTGLLDQFRNSLTDLLSGNARMSVVENRSLLLKVFRNLDHMCRHSPDHTLEYSVVLTMVGRTWSIRYQKGGVVTINAVRARVNSSVTAAASSFSVASEELSFEVKPIKPKKQKGGKPRDVVKLV